MLCASGRKMKYDIFHGDIAEFERPEPQQELRDHIYAACIQEGAIRAKESGQAVGVV